MFSIKPRSWYCCNKELRTYKIDMTYDLRGMLITIGILASICHWKQTFFGMFDLKTINNNKNNFYLHLIKLFTFHQQIYFHRYYYQINNDIRESSQRFFLPITTSTITKWKIFSSSIFVANKFTYCRSKSPPCNINFGITRWKIEFLYPKPFSPVHKARKFSIQIKIPHSIITTFSLHTRCFRNNIIIKLISKKTTSQKIKIPTLLFN